MSADDRVIICSGDECRMIKKGDPIPPGWHVNEEAAAATKPSQASDASAASSSASSSSSSSSFQFSSLFGPSLLRKKAAASPSSVSSSPPATSWACKSCTYSNPPSAEKCGMCEQPSKAPPPPAEYDTVNTDSHLAGKSVGIYFSAHWCPPCRQFTPVLTKFYKQFIQTSKGSNFEIVFVSSDRDASSFDGYFKEMAAWSALPFANRDLKSQLSTKYKVEGIPTFVILNPDGSIATKNGRDGVMNDEQGTEFPWVQKSFWQILGENGGNLIDRDGNSTSVTDLRAANEMIAVYFGTKAHKPCLEYEEALLSLYDTLKKEKKAFEVIFVSADKTAENFQLHLKSMPWKALPFEDSRMKSLFMSYEIDGAPSLLLFDSKSGELANSDALSIVEVADEYPWKSLPLENLQLHKCRRPVLVAFLRGANIATDRGALQSVADSFSAKWFAAGHDFATHPVRFLVSKNDDQSETVLSELMGLKLSESPKSQFGILILPAGVWLSWEDKTFTEENVRKLVTAFENEQRQGVEVHRLIKPKGGHQHEHGENCQHDHDHDHEHDHEHEHGEEEEELEEEEEEGDEDDAAAVDDQY